MKRILFHWGRGGEDFALGVFDGGAGGEPWVVERPAGLDELAGAVETVGAIEHHDDEAARGDALGAIGFRADDGIAIHAGGEAGAGGVGGAGFHSEDPLLTDEFVRVGEHVGTLSGRARDGNLTGFLAGDESDRVAAHRVDRETCHVGGGRVAGLRTVLKAVGIHEKGVLGVDRFREFVHLRNESDHRIAALAAAGENLSADMVGDAERRDIVRGKQRRIERVAESKRVAGREFQVTRRGKLEDDVRHADHVRGDVRLSGGGPIDRDDGGGHFCQGSDRAFHRGVLGGKDFPGIRLDDDVRFLGLEAGGEGEG